MPLGRKRHLCVVSIPWCVVQYSTASWPRKWLNCDLQPPSSRQPERRPVVRHDQVCVGSTVEQQKGVQSTAPTIYDICKGWSGSLCRECTGMRTMYGTYVPKKSLIVTYMSVAGFSALVPCVGSGRWSTDADRVQGLDPTGRCGCCCGVFFFAQAYTTRTLEGALHRE